MNSVGVSLTVRDRVIRVRRIRVLWIDLSSLYVLSVFLTVRDD
jgi:hypothetical protein